MTSELTTNEIFERLRMLATDCHNVACGLDAGDERTTAFSIADILRKLPMRGYANEVADAMNPLLNHCDDDREDEDDE